MRTSNQWVRILWMVVLALGLGALLSVAQETQTKEKSAKGSVSVTGCLQKGDEAGEYAITGEDGKRYGLRSKKVDLAKHVGHKVTVTGAKIREENEANEKHETGGTEVADLRVTNLEMISEGCSK